jgi:hypothetical protein
MKSKQIFDFVEEVVEEAFLKEPQNKQGKPAKKHLWP